MEKGEKNLKFIHTLQINWKKQTNPQSFLFLII